MGQKVHPKSMRLGISSHWDSVWFTDNKKQYAEYLHNDFNIRSYLFKQLAFASVSRVLIQRTARNIKVSVYAARPGAIIGKKGRDIETLRRAIEAIVKESVSFDIIEVRRPELESQLVAESIAQQLEKRMHFRRVMKRAAQSTMRLGAQGIKICVAGRLGGAEIARTEWIREGRVPLHTLRAKIDYATARAKTTYGIIGVKIWIFKGEVTSFEQEEV